MILSIVDKAVKEAKLSDHSHKMGAVIFCKKRIVSIGRNYSSRSAKHLHPRFMRWQGSVHAEANAIIKARRDLKGYDIAVVRVNNSGEWMLAKPCPYCIEYMRYVLLKKCFFTTQDGGIDFIKLN